MNKYELTLILVPTLEDEAKIAEVEKIQEMITRFGGVVDKVDDWGKRRLAYPIKKINEGFYSFTTFAAPGDAPREVENRIRIMDSVLRYLIIRLD